MNKALCIFLFCWMITRAASGQQDTTLTRAQSGVAQDDPSNFITRLELFNELQHFNNGEYLNMTTARSIVALGKRFTTRIDIPVVHNSTTGSGFTQSGLGDISVRLLGYKILDSKRAALLTSVELGLNTAQSPLLGTGKNVITPVVAYSWRIPKRRTILASSFQEYYSVGGDESRKTIRWTRLQAYYLKAWSKKIWTLVLPELYLDHIKGGASMNLETTLFYRLSGRLSVWVKGGKGLFGDHPARYQWTAETGLRYLVMRRPAMPAKKK